MKLARRIRYSEDLSDQNRHCARFFPDEAEYFPNTAMRFLKLFTPVLGIRDILVRIRIISALFPFSQHLYEKREGSGSGAVSWSVPLTNGSGSARPKNLRILRIRIPKTDLYSKFSICLYFQILICRFAWTFPRSFVSDYPVTKN